MRRSHHINSIVKHTWETTITEQSLLNLFPTPPMVVYTRQRNLANFLCHSASPGSVPEGTSTTTLPAPPLPKRVHPCGHAQCKCCTQLLQTHNLHGHPLTQHLNCRSKNIVYLLRCRQHPKAQYVGQTTRQLNQRLNSHRATCLNPGSKATWPLYRHFTSHTHAVEDMLISPLVSVPKAQLLATEALWINRLSTYRWPGLNSTHSLDYLTT